MGFKSEFVVRRVSFRARLFLSIGIVLLLILAIGRMSGTLHHHDAIRDDQKSGTKEIEKSRKDAGDIICAQIYQYRAIGTLYDSIASRCTYGELCIPGFYGQDSLFITWTKDFEAPGIDSTAEYLNSVLISKPFLLTDSTNLSMVRAIELVSDYDTPTFSLPDTTAWSMTLWRKSTNTKIATIDSVGICKAENCPNGRFPSFFGSIDTVSVEMVSIFLGSYVAPGITDSVYLVLHMKNWTAANDGSCSVYDEFVCNSKWSKSMGLSKSSSRQGSKLPASMMIAVFPNPTRSPNGMVRLSLPSERFITLAAYSIDGKHLRTFFAGARSAGVNIIPYDLSTLGHGTFIIQMMDRDGKTIASTKIIYTN